MRVILNADHLRQIEAQGEATYPNEGAGFLLGEVSGETVRVGGVLPVENRREAEAQHNRYILEPRDFMKAELESERLGLSIVGIFHSHPDHPARPSQFDLDHALPNLAYFITSVQKARAAETYSWRLRDDRSAFDEDHLDVTSEEAIPGSGPEA